MVPPANWSSHLRSLSASGIMSLWHVLVCRTEPSPLWELHICCVQLFEFVEVLAGFSCTSHFQQGTCFVTTRTALLRLLPRRQKRKTWSHLMRPIRWARWERFIFTWQGAEAWFSHSWCADLTAAHNYSVFPGKMLILLSKCLWIVRM